MSLYLCPTPVGPVADVAIHGDRDERVGERAERLDVIAEREGWIGPCCCC